MTRLEKSWATRRAKYGPGGGCFTPRTLAWIPDERRGRYDSLKRMYGAATAKDILRMEMADASAQAS